MNHPNDILHASRDRMQHLQRQAATRRALRAAHAATEREDAAAHGLRARAARLLRALADRLEPRPPVRPGPGRISVPPVG